jgi:SRSO17 transposase
MARSDARLTQRLAEYLDQFQSDFRRREQFHWAGVYLHGLLQEGGRKSVETLARRVALVVAQAGRPVDDLAQAMQNFVGQSPWDERPLWQRYRALMNQRFGDPQGVFVIDDITIPKQGEQSAGVQRQFSHALGKKVNCQVAVALYYVGPHVCYPLALRLYLPGKWLRSAQRLDAVGVPAEFRRTASRSALALELVDQARAEGLTCRYVAAGSGYGAVREFRRGLAERGLLYAVDVSEQLLAFGDKPIVARVPGARSRLAPGAPSPMCLAQLADQASWLPIPADAGVKGRYARMLVWLAPDPGTGDYADAEPLQLLVVETEAGPRQFMLAYHQEGDETIPPAALWGVRQAARDAEQRMKAELGLDHFEGRSWRGFHHHSCLVALAYGFTLLSRP